MRIGAASWGRPSCGNSARPDSEQERLLAGLRNSLPIKKMQVARSELAALAALCIRLPIKVWDFRGVFGGFEGPLGLLHGARIEFSL